MYSIKKTTGLLCITLSLISETSLQAIHPERAEILHALTLNFFKPTPEKKAQLQVEANAYETAMSKPFPSARTSYRQLNQDPSDPFAVSLGSAMSQTNHGINNTMHPDNVRSYLQAGIQRAAQVKPWLSKHNPTIQAYNWLKELRWYALQSLELTYCNDCQATVDLNTMPRDEQEIYLIFIARNYDGPKLQLPLCLSCGSSNIKHLAKQVADFTQAHKDAMVEQIRHLAIFDQAGVQAGTRPTYRLSLEMADVTDRSGELDKEKVQAQASWLEQFGNPLLFMQHYAKTRANQFEKPEDIDEFASNCAEIIKQSPQVTHVCPISQVMGFVNRTARQQDLPPFDCSIGKAELCKNVVAAQVAACKAMKEINPNLQTMVSHQWKTFRPYHTFTRGNVGYHSIERAVCAIAHKMYNQGFINAFKEHEDSFDAIALSVYPALYFDRWKPMADCNCSGKIDPEAALDALLQTHKAFPSKDIYIVETGCNTNDPVRAREFIDMTLHVCKVACDLGAPVKGCYFWSQTNDPKFYREWNSPQRSTHFGFYDKIDPADPSSSINAAGKYLKEILAN